MEFTSPQAAAARWGVSPRHVQRLLHDNRIPGAKKYGNYWLIPANAEKPIDPRKARKLPAPPTPAYCFFASIDLPKNDPDAALLGIDAALRPLAMADLAFRRGDPEPAKAVWHSTAEDDASKLSAASLATAAAISSGDYALYEEICRFLQGRMAAAETEPDRALLSLPGTMAEVSMAAHGISPDWLTSGDFSRFSPALRPFLLYLQALHLRNIGDYAAMLAVANATMTLCERAERFTWLDVYLGVLCAAAAYAIGDLPRAKRHLDAALALGIPWGFIAPLADHLGELGGMLEDALEQQYPAYTKPVLQLWNRSFKNWMRFHNIFTKDNISTVLSPQEYHAARLIARGATYAQAAQRMHLSVSRVKNILTDVYTKLYIHSRQELSELIL